MKRSAAAQARASAPAPVNVARMTPEGFQPGQAVAREVRFAPSSYDAPSRTIEAVFATGAPVRRWGYVESLNMTPEACDLTRVAQGQCRLLDSHNAFSIEAILGLVETASFVDGQLAGRLRFADTPLGRQAEQMAADGILTGLSIGYAVQTWTLTSVESDVENWRADKWTLLEVTFCAVPADPGASVRSGANGHPAQTLETDDMRRSASSTTGAPGPVATAAAALAAAPVAADIRAAAPAAALVAAPAPAPAPAAAAVRELTPGVLSAVMTPGETVTLLRQADAMGVRTIVDDMIVAGASAAAIRETMLARVAERQAAPGNTGGPRAEITRDAGDTLRRAVASSILLRANPSAIDRATADGRADHEMAAAYRGMSLLECFRAYTEETGVRLRNVSRMELAGLALGMRDEGVMQRSGLSTSDFPNILANIATKRLRDAYGAVRQPWRQFCRQQNSPDFKQKAVVALSGLPDFRKVREGQEFEKSGLSDTAEKYSLATYGRIVPITRQALINDDLGAFDRLPTFVGRAAAELENATVWAIFTANAAMGDTVALFHATHKNLGTAAGITEAALTEAQQLLNEQLDASGTTPLNLAPMFLVVTPARVVAAQKLLTAVMATTTGSVNVFANRLNLISEARLIPASGAQPWFVIGDPSQIDTIEYSYLDGQEGVYTEQRIGFEVDGIEIKGRLDFAAKAIDWRNMVKNAGT